MERPKKIHLCENEDGDCMSEVFSRKDGRVSIEQWQDGLEPSNQVHYSLDDCKQLVKFLTTHIEENGG